MTAETQEESGPDLDWMTAQPYDAWAEVRRSECPVMNAGLDIMGPGTGTFFQVAAFKDADAVLRDDKTFSSSINGDHIGQFMGDLILAMNGNEHRTYRNLVAKAFRASNCASRPMRLSSPWNAWPKWEPPSEATSRSSSTAVPL